MNSFDILPPVFSHNTNERPAVEDEAAVEGTKRIVEFFNHI